MHAREFDSFADLNPVEKPMPSSRTFGLDLSGYSGERSALVEIVQGETRLAVIYRDHPFAKSAVGRDRLADIVTVEREALVQILQLGTILVDVPIDLQCLPFPPTPTFAWQLTARPVDFAYGGLRPLADRIGAPVARFQNLIAEYNVKAEGRSDRLLETYPAASLLCAGAPSKGYKGQIIEWDDGRWVGDVRLREIAQSLRLVATELIKLSDDEVDAIVCGLAGAGPEDSVLAGEALANDMRKRLREKMRLNDAGELDKLYPPRSYQLLRKLPISNVCVQVRQWPPSL